MKKLIPLILILIGIGGGVGAGLALRPDPSKLAAMPGCAPGDDVMHADTGGDKAKDTHGKDAKDDDGHDGDTEEYVKLDNQFVIPVVIDASIESLVVMSLSIEVTAGGADLVYQHEPKLRDNFLEVLFAHANMGGFRGSFTDANNLAVLKRALLESGRAVLGDVVTGVLITDLGRRDE